MIDLPARNLIRAVCLCSGMTASPAFADTGEGGLTADSESEVAQQADPNPQETTPDQASIFIPCLLYTSPSPRD